MLTPRPASRSIVTALFVALPLALATLAGMLAGAPAVVAAAGATTTVDLPGSTDRPGLTVTAQDPTGVTLHFEIGAMTLEPLELEGGSYTQVSSRVSMPEAIVPRDAGAPDLPGIGRWVAVPRGATAVVRTSGVRTTTLDDVRVAPAPVIPRETDDGPLVYAEDP
ncbi:MAG: C25 family peptidase propeptide domain-containing protein, partial [Candidatus Eiseniibacteriota bacterium]